MSDSKVGFSFRPSFEGAVKVDRVPEDWIDRVRHRLADGLLVPGRRARSNYRVVSATGDSLVFEAVGFATAYAIGLNHVELRLTESDTLSYRVEFTRWNRYVVAHGALLGLAIAVGSLQPKLRAQIETHSWGPWIFWSMVGFWSLVWPWILTGIHRKYVRENLEDILLEELEDDEPRRAHAS